MMPKVSARIGSSFGCRKHRPDLKVIFVSGYAEDAFRKNLPEGETFNFLPKPFSLKQLVETVKEIIAQ